MANIHTTTEISKNATYVKSDCKIMRNCTTETNSVNCIINCTGSSNVDYFNLEPSDRQNSDIGYCSSGMSSGTKNSLGFEQKINNSANIPSYFEKIHHIPNSNKKMKVTVHGINNKVFNKMQTLLKYNGIHESLSINLSKLKYHKTTIIQKYAVPIFMGGRDMIARTPSGSGKTTAIVILSLNCLLKNLSEINRNGHRSDPLAVIVVPTKQRVEYIYNVLSRLSTNTSIKCGPLFDIKSTSGQKRVIQNGVHIIVATPESLVGFVSRDWITFIALQIIVLDKVDFMIEMGFKPEIEFILNNKTMVSTDKRTTALLSTTITNGVKQLAMTYLKPNYVSIDIEEIVEVPTTPVLELEKQLRTDAGFSSENNVP